jgi:methionyl-tRNA synthetase
MLLSAGLELPRTVFAHGFFTINGEKISKTIGNVIDPVALSGKYGNDTLRYFLLREIPFGEDGDFSEEKLRERYQADLANGLGNLLSRVTNLIEKNCDGVVPEIRESPQDLTEVYEFTQTLRFHEALQKIWRAVDWANQYIDSTKLWEQPKKDPKLFGEAISSLAALLLDIAKKLVPYMPETAEKLRVALSAERIEKASPLFPRLE